MGRGLFNNVSFSSLKSLAGIAEEPAPPELTPEQRAKQELARLGINLPAHK